MLTLPQGSRLDDVASEIGVTQFLNAMNAAGLSNILKSPKKYTIFVPTNRAFASLQPNLLQLLFESENIGLLSRFMMHHIISGTLLTDDLHHGQQLETLTEEHIGVVRSGSIVIVGGGLVTNGDVLADNGVLHVIDTVLVPTYTTQMMTTSTTTTTSSTHTSTSTTLFTTSTTSGIEFGPSLNLLDPSNARGTIVVDEEDGGVIFDGSEGFRLRHFEHVNGSFSFAFIVTQTPLTSGYLFAKTDSSGSRFYALLSRRTSNSLVFFYRIVGSPIQFVTKFEFSITDGVTHPFLFTVNGTVAILNQESQQDQIAYLAGPVDDCQIPSNDCIFNIGQSLTSDGEIAFPFQGVMTFARLFFQPITISDTQPDDFTTTTGMSTTTATSPTTSFDFSLPTPTRFDLLSNGLVSSPPNVVFRSELQGHVFPGFGGLLVVRHPQRIHRDFSIFAVVRQTFATNGCKFLWSSFSFH